MDKILIDTTYILPLFGIKIKLEDIEVRLPEIFKKYKVIYSPLSIVEAKWIILKLIKKYPSKKDIFLKSFRNGLKILLVEENIYKTRLTTPEVEDIADLLLLKAEIKDYFDRMIYATAVSQESILMTEDMELKSLENSELPKPKKIISWEEIIR